jgi:topoisomerase-4 subunit B
MGPSLSKTTAAAFRSALHPEEKAPVIELVFTRLHAGGKFDKGKGGAYSFSGGLHGVGVSVTNALATRLEATSYREGKVARLVFSGGDVVEPLVISEAGPGERRSGTVVRVWPIPGTSNRRSCL